MDPVDVEASEMIDEELGQDAEVSQILGEDPDRWYFLASELVGALAVLRAHVDEAHAGDFQFLVERYWEMAEVDGYTTSYRVG